MSYLKRGILRSREKAHEKRRRGKKRHGKSGRGGLRYFTD